MNIQVKEFSLNSLKRGQKIMTPFVMDSLEYLLSKYAVIIVYHELKATSLPWYLKSLGYGDIGIIQIGLGNNREFHIINSDKVSRVIPLEESFLVSNGEITTETLDDLVKNFSLEAGDNLMKEVKEYFLKISPH